MSILLWCFFVLERGKGYVRDYSSRVRDVEARDNPPCSHYLEKWNDQIKMDVRKFTPRISHWYTQFKKKMWLSLISTANLPFRINHFTNELISWTMPLLRLLFFLLFAPECRAIWCYDSVKKWGSFSKLNSDSLKIGLAILICAPIRYCTENCFNQEHLPVLFGTYRQSLLDHPRFSRIQITEITAVETCAMWRAQSITGTMSSKV